SMSPAPTQLLSYLAGRTKRLALGTAVIVLPWHDPIRVAEQIALLDILCGTPDDCIQQIAELRALTGTDHLIADFSYGGMPHEEGEQNMRLFADRVVPVLQRDALFAVPPAHRATSDHEDVFAPA